MEAGSGLQEQNDFHETQAVQERKAELATRKVWINTKMGRSHLWLFSDTGSRPFAGLELVRCRFAICCHSLWRTLVIQRLLWDLCVPLVGP